MGIHTILNNSKKIIIMANSESKARIAKVAIEGPISSDIPATYLQCHNNCLFVIDRAASEKLTRFSSPWTIKGIRKQAFLQFDDHLRRKAVIWLSTTLKKSISKLVADDYEKNGLYQLLEENPNIMDLNSEVMEYLRSKITDFPAGKTNSKKILIFSPHPDDDVICMGGTMRKLINAGHQVYVAYQTSGNIGVFDHDALRFANFLAESAKLLNFPSKEVNFLKFMLFEMFKYLFS